MPPPTSKPLEPTFGESGICVLESDHADDFRMTWTQHRFWKLLLVRTGSGQLQTRKSRGFLKAPTLVIIPPGLEHRLIDTPGSALRVYVLCIFYPFPCAKLEAFHAMRPTFFSLPSLVEETTDGLRRILLEQSHKPEELYYLETGIVSLLLSRLLREKPMNPTQIDTNHSIDRVKGFTRQLQTEFYTQDTIENAAQRCGLGRRRFTQLIKQATGCTWVQYRAKLRVEHACRLLHHTQRAVGSIAFECGFEEESHFYRVFRARTGKTPLAWRATERK
ncbi:MAG: AraC family transcriptional regulator [Chthoniobacterales bacterium]